MGSNGQSCILDGDIFFAWSWIYPGVLKLVAYRLFSIVQAGLQGVEIVQSYLLLQLAFDVVTTVVV